MGVNESHKCLLKSIHKEFYCFTDETTPLSYHVVNNTFTKNRR